MHDTKTVEGHIEANHEEQEDNRQPTLLDLLLRSGELMSEKLNNLMESMVSKKKNVLSSINTVVNSNIGLLGSLFG